jgi:hypothetical protein
MACVVRQMYGITVRLVSLTPKGKPQASKLHIVLAKVSYSQNRDYYFSRPLRTN